MWPFLPKKCDCPDTPNNQGTSCDHSGLTTNDLIYDGPNGVCSNIVTGMTATEVFQQLDYFICTIELTQYILNEIQNNIEEYPEFITLVNGAINCDTINNCGPRPTTTTTSSSTSTTSSTSTSTSTTSTSTSSTTTTTTTVAEECYVYNLTATINNASWIAQLCSGGVTSGVLPFIGNTFTTPCIINTSLVLNGITATTDFLKCNPITTTTTTTVYCECFQVFANDGDTVYYTDCNGDDYEEIFEGTPSTIPPLIGPNSKLYCAQVVTVVEPYFIRDLGPCILGSYCEPTTSTTSTTSSTTSTTTSTSSSTTTTTTTINCVAGDLVLINETIASQISDVYVNLPDVWSIATPTPVPPNTTYVGAQGGTTGAINVDLNVTQVSCISLYINCVKIYVIPVPSTGTYTFPAISIPDSAAVTIILTETGSCSL